MRGILIGGWEFVWGAYAVTAVTLVGYTVSLVVRWRAERARAGRPSEVSR